MFKTLKIKNLSVIGFLLFVLVNASCSDAPKSAFVAGAVGQAGEQTPVYRDTHGNPWGFIQYLPKAFDAQSTQKWPLIFYWNGSNTITGDGLEKDLKRILNQGLPLSIRDGLHIPAIVISAQLENWKENDIHPFVQYTLQKYAAHIDLNKIYMTGFSAGGGITTRYIIAHPDILAAAVPIAPALRAPADNQPSDAMAAVPIWFFHNAGDPVVESQITQMWYDALIKKSSVHKFTKYPVAGHYAWQATYANPQMWDWLFAQSKGR